MDGYLFSPLLVENDPNEKELVARPLHIDDFSKGFLSILSELTQVGEVDESTFRTRFQEMKNAQDVYYVVVIEDVTKQKIIGTATLVVERKFIRGAGKAGHIEDVVVDSTYRGKQLGKKVIEHLRKLAGKLGCYKVILDCSEKNVAFYEKCGFQKKEVLMAYYFDKSKL